MINKNSYSNSYQDNDNKIDYLKYGLTNEYGYSLIRKYKKIYNEEELIKKRLKP